MSRIKVKTILDAPPEVVWADIENIASHVEWMADAESITFTSATSSGVGTTFDCVTAVGPLRLTDRMEITDWQSGASMGVRHVGLVTGTGRFTLQARKDGRTTFQWNERLIFPWWMGGPIGGIVGGRVLKLIWKRNLRRLAQRFTTDPA